MREPDEPAETPELDDRERAALDAWPAAVPPAGFAERVLAARQAAPAPAGPASRPKSGRLGTAAAVVAVACAAALVLALVRGTDVAMPPAAGALVARDRASVAVGRRAVAVAEPGAALAWTVDGTGAARVEQGAGSVFYRVERGGPFVVVTPAGEVRVTGTCFDVEVQPMKPTKQSLIGGAVGAALAVAAVVTVYEGGVVVAGRDRSVQVAAGQRATIDADGHLAVGDRGPASASVTPGVIAAPPSAATREQLLARDQQQRTAIAALEAKVGSLESQLAAARQGGEHGMFADDGDGRPWFDPSPEKLLAMAKNCHLRIDAPGVFDTEPHVLNAREAASYGLDPGEVDGFNATMRDIHSRWSEQIRALYVEVTGDAAAAEALSPQALAQEILDKSPPDDRRRIQARIAQERAGLVPVPADASKASPVERYFRQLTTLGNDTEQVLAKRFGPKRAREMREKNNGWENHFEASGCREGSDEDTDVQKR